MSILSDHEALYRVEARVQQRSAGRSAVAAAAYRSASRLTDTRTGRTYDYTRKACVESWIMTPDGAPAWATDRQQVWDRAEAAERRRDAVLARELIVSIPRDIPPDARRALTEDIARPIVATGAIVDIAIHSPRAADREEQPHAHMMITLRETDPEAPTGFAGRRNGALESLFESGGRRGGGTRGDALKALRAAIAVTINRHLAEVGSRRRADARSLSDRGIDRVPEPKIGEERMHAVRRRRHHDRRTQMVHALREARRTSNELARVEGQMATQKKGFPRLRKDRTPRAGGAGTDYRAALLLERYPGLDATPHAQALYMVDVRRKDRTRILMKDGGWVEAQGSRVRTWGPGVAAPALARDLAALVGADDGVGRLERTAAVGRDGYARPVVIREAAAVALADGWRERGYTDVSESPDGVWIHLGETSRLRDTGDHVSVYGTTSDDAIRAVVEKGRDEWGGRLESHGPESFRARLWLECQRQGVTVSGYEPPESLRMQWEAEQARRAADGEALAGVRRVTGDADVLIAAARGTIESLSRLDPELRAFVSSYLDDDQRRDLARRSATDVAPELARFRSYGHQELERDPDAASVPTARRPDPGRDPDPDRRPT